MSERTRRAAGELRTAWCARSVRWGFVGSLLILVGSLSPAYLPASSPFWDFLYRFNLDNSLTRWSGTVLTMVGLGLLLDAWLRLRPARREVLGRPQLRHWAVLAIVGFPLLWGPPVFSHDAYSYAAQGWLLHNNINPYSVGPGVLPGSFADQVAWIWRDTPAPYGPLALRMSEWIVIGSGFDPYLSAVLMRIPAILGVGLIGWCIPRIARRVGVDPAAASWFAVVNPVLIVDYIGGAHNDAMMTGLMVLGIHLTMRTRHWWSGALVVGVAAAIKQPAILASVALPFLVHPCPRWRPRDILRFTPRVLLCVGLGIGVFAGLSVITGLGFGWINAVDVPGMAETVSPFSVLGHLLQYGVNALGLDATGRAAIAVSKSVGLVVAGVGIVWLAWRHLGRRPLPFLSWSLLLFALCAPAIHSWYVLWGGVLFPMTRPREKWLRVSVVGTAVLLGYAAANFAIRNGLGLFAVALVIVAFDSLRAHELSQRFGLVHEDEAETQPATSGRS